VERSIRTNEKERGVNKKNLGEFCGKNATVGKSVKGRKKRGEKLKR